MKTTLTAVVLMMIALHVPVQARADDNSGKYPNGIQATFSAGQGYAAIQNPDSTTAYYQTLSVEGRGHLPMIGNSSSLFGLDVIGTLRYLDLKNTSPVTNEKEVANLIGPGVGLNLRFSRLIAGANTEYIFARHYAVGAISRELDYSMTTLNYYYGFQYSFGNLAIGATMSTSNGTVPKSASGLSSDSAYSDQLYWLNLTYSTGASVWRLFDTIF